MEIRESGHFVVSAALALIAGVLGSLLTLLVTSNLTVPVIRGTNTLSVQSAAESESTVATTTTADPLTTLIADADASELQGQGMAHLQDEFRIALKQASEERGQLADALALLTQQISSLESDVINRRSLDVQSALAMTPDASQQGESESGNGFARAIDDRAPQATLDSLVAAGIDYDSAWELQARQDQYQLARLELVDQAEREGWRDSEQFAERLKELEDQQPDIRSELGDDVYDRYLFESGRSNRVSIVSIIPGSEAELAGVQIGDTVFSYADVRVFSTGDLQRATRAGQRGELVTLQVERQGQPVFIEVARGPLGVSLNPELQKPS